MSPALAAAAVLRAARRPRPAGSRRAIAARSAARRRPVRSAQVDARSDGPAGRTRPAPPAMSITASARAGGREQPRDAQRHVPQAALHRERVARTDARARAAAAGRQEHRVGANSVEPVGRAGDQRRRRAARREDVDADDPQRVVAPATRASTSTTGLATATSGSRASCAIERLVETARAVRAPRGRHRRRASARRAVNSSSAGRVDELHRVAERDAERDRRDAEQRAQPLLGERAAEQRRGDADADRSRDAALMATAAPRRPSRVSSSTRSAVCAAALRMRDQDARGALPP